MKMLIAMHMLDITTHTKIKAVIPGLMFIVNFKLMTYRGG